MTQSSSPTTTPTPTNGDQKVDLLVQIDPDLLDQIQHLTSDPSRIVEAAVRRWLKGESFRDEDLARTLPRNVPVPPRGEWND